MRKAGKTDFRKILKETEKRFGKIKRGEEHPYDRFFFVLEGNLMKCHRLNPSSNSRKVMEAIQLVCLKIMGRTEHDEYDASDFEDENNLPLVNAILMTFDPYTNEEVMDIFMDEPSFNLNDDAFMEEYYKPWMMMLLRLYDSVDFWIRNRGSDGYFIYMEEGIGKLVTEDGQYHFILTLGKI